MIISGIWTHFGYADEFDVDEYKMERDAWLNLINTLLNENYHFDMIHSQNSASYFRENQMLLLITLMLELELPLWFKTI